MPEPTLEDRLGAYGSALDEARRGGVVRRVSVVRRVAPVVAVAAAIALLVTALVVIPDSGKRRTLPADVPAAEAAIRRAFETLLDRSLPVDERRAATETLGDPAAQARAIERWNALLSVNALDGASVQRIEFVDASTADVDLGFELSGAQANVVPVRAVLRDGSWRVAYATACAFGNVIRPACAPDDFLTAEEQAIGQPFVDIAWRDLPDDTRVREIQGGTEIRSQVLDAVNRHRNMLGERTEVLAVRHRHGEKSAKVWWTVGTVQPGVAVLDGNHWTVSRDTWCKLSQNAGEYPHVCGGASTTTSAPTAVTSTSVPSVQPFTWDTGGSLVRGAPFTMRVHGLARLRGQQVDLAIAERFPPTTDSTVGLYRGEDPAGQLRGGTVDDHGDLVVEGVVPNLLATYDGGHLYRDVQADRTYELFVTVGEIDVSIWYRSTVRFTPAVIGTPYVSVVRNNRGGVDCGAPRFEVVFDARHWTPDDASAFAADRDTFPGTITLVSRTTARFRLDDGRVVPLSLGSGWFC